MALEMKSVMVRLTDEAYDVLALIADVHGSDKGEVAREILTRALLGEGHAIRLAAQRFARALTSDKRR
jgi:plasmid stability protein